MIDVVGLDLSLSATGLSRLAFGLEQTTFKPKTVGDARLVEIKDWVGIAVEGAELVVVEDLPFGHNKAAGQLGMLHGAVRVELLEHYLRYILVPPATLKMYATGRGNAPKPDMRMELYKRTGRDLPDDNQVDAEWLRLLGLDLAGEPALELPQAHRRALLKLHAPDFDGVTEGG
jgi:Holliday junction resolvasome RuvABC endonuclease subunit